MRSPLPSNSSERAALVMVLLTAVLAAVAGVTAIAQPARTPATLIDSPSAIGNLRNQLADTRLVARNDLLTPCDFFDKRAVSDRRPSASGLWAGEFEVLTTAPGDWFVVVEGGGLTWRQRVSRKGERWLTPAFAAAAVDVFLEGPGTGTPCPQVILRSELRGGQAASTRGVVGMDERWHLASAELRALADFKTIESWAPSIVHLQIFDAERGLPCSGFFVAPHLVMTARHCVMTTTEAANTSVDIGTEIVRAPDLLVSQEDLDFSLLWVNTTSARTPLAMRAQPAAPMVLWQSPAARELLVSVVDCGVAAGSTHFFHRCDTSVGTSGAPIQNRADGAVVALHTDGCTISGSPQCVNFGTSIGDIRARLSDRLPLLEQFHPMAGAELRAALK